MKAETISISIFKATCLDLLKRVNKTGRPLLITLRGEPVAMVTAPDIKKTSSGWLDSMQGSASICGDIVAPVEDEVAWKVMGK